jgi:hypothetical protein
MKWIEVNGVVKKGHLIASGQAKDSPYPRGSIEMQVPFFKQRGLDLSYFHPATLNIDISPISFQMVNPQYIFRGVNWTSIIPPEDFSFSKCEISNQANWYPGWVYYPHPKTKPQHFQDASTIEIITHYIVGIGYSDLVRLRLIPNEIRLENFPD